MLRVAIIDDGVNFSRIGINENKASNLEYDATNGWFRYCDDDSLTNNHGTICTDIIYNLLETNEIQFYSLKILNPLTGRGNTNQLIAALRWCIHNKIDVVNCSLGSTSPLDFSVIRSVINEVIINNVIVIAAMSNKNVYTLPACSPGVIGVKHNFLYMDLRFKLKWYPLDEIEIETCGESRLLSSAESRCNSFATSKVTAIVINLLAKLQTQNRLSCFQILKLLQMHATTTIGEYDENIHTTYPWNFTFIYNEYYINAYQKNLLKYLKSSVRIEVPIITILRHGGNLEETLFFSLASYMVQQGTYIQVLCDDISFAQNHHNVIFIPLGVDHSSFVCNIQGKFMFDAFLLFTFESDVISDLSIKQEGTYFCIKQIDNRCKRIKISASFSVDDFSKMIYKILI